MMMRAYLLSFAGVLMSLYLTACDFSTDPVGGNSSEESSSGSGDGFTYENGTGAGEPLSKATEINGAGFESGFDAEEASCWDIRDASGYARTPCGPWGSIGSSRAVLAKGAGRSGSDALSVTFTKNEEVGGASLSMDADVLHVRAYYNFSEGFDFGQGVKIGRASAFNGSGNDIDIIMTVRSPQGGNQCGVTDMADLGLFFNGKPAGYDWGSIGSPVRFERGRWYAVEYAVRLNAPGRSDGSVKLWVDGNLVASKEGVNLRGKGGESVKLNRVRIGGWYSNGAHGNGCKDPGRPSTMLVDDVAVGTDLLGVKP
jgi:hypothetical protein